VLDPATIDRPRLIASLTAEGLSASAFATDSELLGGRLRLFGDANDGFETSVNVTIRCRPR
jgi:hypothetical protein